MEFPLLRWLLLEVFVGGVAGVFSRPNLREGCIGAAGHLSRHWFDHPWTVFLVIAAAPLLVFFLVLGVLSLRGLQQGSERGMRLLRRLLVAELVVLALLFGLYLVQRTGSPEPRYGSKSQGRIARQVLRYPGKQLCLVRDSGDPEVGRGWIFSEANPPSDRLIWVRSADAAADRRAIASYPGREVWLVKPDQADDLLSPYPTPAGSGPVDPANAALGLEPAPDLAARDVFVDYLLPPFEDRAEDGLWASVRGTKVLSRARLLKVDSHSATQAWFAAESTFRAASAMAATALPQTPVRFCGVLASELNVLLARRDVLAVKVCSAELLIDTPLRIGRDHVSLDLANARLRSTGGLPYLVRIEGVHDVTLSGGSLEGGAWGVLVSRSSRVAVLHMKIEDLSGGGVVVANSEEVAVWGNRLEALGGAAVLLQGQTSRVTVASNEIVGNLGSSNWHAGVVLTDRIADLAADPSSLLKSDNYWSKEQPMADRLAIPQNNVVFDNHITGNASSGIYSDGSARNVFLGNRIESNSKEGLCLDNGSLANVVSGNLLRGNGKRWGKSDLDLRRDFVFPLGRLGDGSSPAKVPAISMDNAAYNQIIANEIDRNFGGGVKMVRTAFYNIVGLNTLTNNNEGRNDKFHFFGVEVGAAQADATSVELDFTPSRGNEIFGNILRGSHYAGIFLADGSDRNNLFDNSIFGATNWGMESSQVQANITLNNLTNLPLRNIESGLQGSLAKAGVGVRRQKR